MQRRHLFEFEDLEWFPNSLRNVITDILSFFLTHSKTYEHSFYLLKRVFRFARKEQMTDLCSGAGLPAIMSYHQLQNDPEIKLQPKLILTDKFPNEQLHKKGVHIKKMDILKDRTKEQELCTIFSAFHHFQPSQARRILLNLTQGKGPIAIFEFTQRSWSGIFFMLLGLPIAFFCAPFIKPFSWSRIFWVNIIPIAPLVLFWDGVVSALRTYTPKELIHLTKGLDDYYWQSGVVRKFPLINITYLIGISHEDIEDHALQLSED